MSASAPPRLLLVEDSAEDAEMILRVLADNGLTPEWERASSLDALQRALAEKPWDLVISDYQLPPVTALDVLRAVRERSPDLPVIVVSGKIGEETAVEALRAGARDYVFKDRPARLGEAVRNVLRAEAERRRAREALELSGHIIESSSVGITVYGPDLRYLVWNPVMERLTGLAAADMIGRHPLEALPVLKENGIWGLIERALKGDVVQADDILSSRPGVPPVWTSPRFGPLRDGRGKIVGVVGMIRDVTDRHRAEEQVLRALERERAARGEIEDILDRVSDGFVSLDLEWRYTYMNRHAGEIFGRKAADMIGRHIWTEFPEGQGQKFHLAYERALREQKPLVIEEYYPPYDKWFENRIYPSPTGLSIFFSDVTERRRTEESRARLAMILEGTPDFVGFSDAAGNVLYVNPAGRRMLGLSDQDPVPSRILDFHPDRLERVYQEKYLPAAHRDGVWRGESRLLARDGREIPVSQVIVAHRNKRGEVERFSTIARDITFEKRAEAEILEKGERFREIAENIREVFWVIAPDLSRTLYLSPAFETVFGLRREQVYEDPLTWAEAIHPEDRERAIETVRREAPRGAYEQTYRTLRPDGSVRWIHDRAFPVRDADGRLVRIVGLAEDITELKTVEEELRRLNATLEDKVRERTAALQESEGTLESIFNSQATFVGLISLDGRVLRVNHAPLQAAGLRWEDVAGRPVWDTPWFDYAEESRRRVRADLERVAGGDIVAGEYRIRVGAGRFILIAAAFRPIRDARGRVSRILGEAIDVTERREAEAALEASERKFRSLVATVPGVVYRCETRAPWRMSFISEAVLALSGYPPADFMEGRRTWASIMLPEDVPKVSAQTEEATRAGRSVLLEYRIRRSDGTIRWVMESGQPVVSGPGGEAYAEGVILDVTPRKIAETALERSEEERLRLEELTRVRGRFEGIVGKSAPMQEVYRRLRLAGQSDVTVLLTGESGTGKELAAAAIHSLSARKGNPFVTVNCSAIPEPLLESELFGHVKGAFTGAVRDKAGLFQLAEGGTLFLDEVGDMPVTLQVKVLRALQEREIRRVGDESSRRVNVRVVAATNRDLAARIAEGALREDFYYRIRVFEIALPPLRERKDDIPVLASQFLEDLSKPRGKKIRPLGVDVLRRLMEHSWPGNVRELRNALEYALVTMTGDRVSVEDLPPEIGAPVPRASAVDNAERKALEEVLRKAGGNRTTAAKLLGVSRVTLWKRMKKLGIGEV